MSNSRQPAETTGLMTPITIQGARGGFDHMVRDGSGTIIAKIPQLNGMGLKVAGVFRAALTQVIEAELQQKAAT